MAVSVYLCMECYSIKAKHPRIATVEAFILAFRENPRFRGSVETIRLRMRNPADPNLPPLTEPGTAASFQRVGSRLEVTFSVYRAAEFLATFGCSHTALGMATTSLMLNEELEAEDVILVKKAGVPRRRGTTFSSSTREAR
jgi:hypothetical protein